MRIIKKVRRAIKFRLCLLLSLAGIGLSLTLSAFAHHSQSEFDFRSSVEVEGTVVKLEWRSPHARLYLDVVDDNGEVVSWNFELPSPNTLMRRGWTRRSILPGEKVSVTGIRARNFPTIGLLRSIIDEDGEAVFTGATPIK